MNRFRLLTALAVGVLVASCSSAVTGVAETAGYRPIPGESLQATVIELPERTLAVSPTATQAVTRTDDGVCLVSLLDADSPLCPELPDGARVDAASFSPDGSAVALFEDARRTFSSRLFVFDLATGAVREVASDSEQPPLVFAAGWMPDGRLVGIAAVRDDDGYSDLVFVVDPGSAVFRPAGAPLPEDQRLVGSLTVGAGLAAYVVRSTGEQTDSVQVLDLESGQVRNYRILPAGVSNARGLGTMLLDISPDGSRLLLTQYDVIQFEYHGFTEVDLATGTLSPVPGIAEGTFGTAAYSPDGERIAVVHQDLQQRDSTLAVVTGDGEAVVLDTLLDTALINSRLTWTVHNLLVPTQLPGGGVELPAWRLAG